MSQIQQEVVVNRRRVNLSLPSKSELVRFVGWSCGRLVLVSVPVACDVGMVVSKVIYSTFELLKRSWSSHILKVYDALPYQFADGGVLTETETTTAPFEPLTFVDISYKSPDAYHDLIIAQSKGGKSTTAQYLALVEDAEVKVYDPHEKLGDWGSLPVIGGGRNFRDIASCMTADLEEMQRRFERRARGEDVGRKLIIICDEFPAIAGDAAAADVAPRWLATIGREAGKVGIELKVLAQDDNVATLGIEGQGQLRKCFRYIRLSKAARAYAKQTKNRQLIEWANTTERPCFLDEYPCQLPDLNQMRLQRQLAPTILQPRRNHAITPQQSPEQSPEPAQGEDSGEIVSGGDRLLWRLICQLGAGKSDSVIVTEVLGYTGRRYQQGCELLADLRAKFGGSEYL